MSFTNPLKGLGLALIGSMHSTQLIEIEEVFQPEATRNLEIEYQEYKTKHQSTKEQILEEAKEIQTSDINSYYISQTLDEEYKPNNLLLYSIPRRRVEPPHLAVLIINFALSALELFCLIKILVQGAKNLIPKEESNWWSEIAVSAGLELVFSYILPYLALNYQYLGWKNIFLHLNHGIILYKAANLVLGQSMGNNKFHYFVFGAKNFKSGGIIGPREMDSEFLHFVTLGMSMGLSIIIYIIGSVVYYLQESKSKFDFCVNAPISSIIHTFRVIRCVLRKQMNLENTNQEIPIFPVYKAEFLFTNMNSNVLRLITRMGLLFLGALKIGA